MWQSATICDVTTVGLQLSNGTVHRFHKILLFYENVSSPTFILGYSRPNMIVHALDQLDY